jgi:putative transposase
MVRLSDGDNDWHTRYVLSWRITNTLDSSACLEAHNEALEWHVNQKIFNTDQGRSLQAATSSQEYLRAGRFLSAWTARAGLEADFDF